jgi:hypothetical protein
MPHSKPYTEPAFLTLVTARRADKVTQIAKSVKDRMSTLVELAVKGNVVAAVEMFKISALGTGLLDYVCRKRPDLLRPIAAHKTAWPMMRNPHPETAAARKAFAKHLKLGCAVGIDISQPGKPFSLKRPANQIAIYLHKLAQALRRAPIKQWDVYEWILLASVGRFQGSPSNYSVGHDPQQMRDLEEWGQRTGKKLPALSRATVGQWKPATRELFKLVYGKNFDAHPHLQRLKTAVMKHAKDYLGEKGGPGIVREAMLRKVLQALSSIAPLD